VSGEDGGVGVVDVAVAVEVTIKPVAGLEPMGAKESPFGYRSPNAAGGPRCSSA
jgi:hypothetical protein